MNSQDQPALSQSEEKSIIEQIMATKDIITKAKLIKYLHSNRKIRIRDLSELLSHDTSYICNLIRILRLPTLILDGYYSKSVSTSHLIVLSRLKNEDDQVLAYEQVLANSCSVEQTQELVRQILYKVDTKGKRLEQKFIDQIRQNFRRVDENVEVQIVQTQIKAKISIVFKGNLEKTSKFLRRLNQIIASID